jgi:YfiR/HmsC-like
MNRPRQRILHVALALLLGAGAGDVAGIAVAAEGERANELKAAYLFNFAKLVEWPASTPATHLTICFAGAPDVHDAFARAVGDKQVGARRIVVKYVDAPESHTGCDVLYLDGALAGGVQNGESTAPAMLTVSDARNFVAHGGMIELFPEGNRLRFNINLPSAQRAGLRISSNLLQLAARVEKGER